MDPRGGTDGPQFRVGSDGPQGGVRWTSGWGPMDLRVGSDGPQGGVRWTSGWGPMDLVGDRWSPT